MVQITGTDPDGDAIGRPVQWQAEGPPPLILMAPEPRGRPALAPASACWRGCAGSAPALRGTDGEAPRRDAGAHPRRPIAAGASCPPTGAPRPNGSCRRGRRAARGRRDRARRAAALDRPRAQARARHRAAGRHGRCALGQPDRHPHATTSRPNSPPEALAEARAGPRRRRRAAASDLRGTAAGDHRRRGRARLRRRGVRRAGRRRVSPRRRHRRRRALRAPRLARSTATARTRGNSCYFPDRVVPMLPEALSNGWCSLRPGEDRGCLFVEMRIDAEGRQDQRTASAAA